MDKKLRRTAAFSALGRALTAGARGGPSLGTRLAALPRMIGASMRGRYDGGLRVAMMSAITVYIVSPIDFVPEAFLTIFGLADDAVAAAWLAGAILSETERFLTWEAVQNQAKAAAAGAKPHVPPQTDQPRTEGRRGKVIPGEVIPPRGKGR